MHGGECCQNHLDIELFISVILYLVVIIFVILSVDKVRQIPMVNVILPTGRLILYDVYLFILESLTKTLNDIILFLFSSVDLYKFYAV